MPCLKTLHTLPHLSSPLGVQMIKRQADGWSNFIWTKWQNLSHNFKHSWAVESLGRHGFSKQTVLTYVFTRASSHFVLIYNVFKRTWVVGVARMLQSETHVTRSCAYTTVTVLHALYTTLDTCCIVYTTRSCAQTAAPAHSPLYKVYSIHFKLIYMYAIHCILHGVLLTMHFAIYSVYCTLNSENCALHFIAQ